MCARPNDPVADVFDEIADLLAIEDETPFRILAYRNAAATLRGLATPLREMVERGDDLTELDGIGDATAKKIVEIVTTGRCAFLEQQREQTGAGLGAVLRLPGLGPKRVRALRDELGVRSIDDLTVVAERGLLRGLRGFGSRTEARILEALRRARPDGDSGGDSGSGAGGR